MMVTIEVPVSEASRLEDDRRRVTATLRSDASLPLPAAFDVELVRRRPWGDVVVAEEPTVVSTADPVPVEFHLDRLLDAQGLSIARRGRYVVRARPVATPGEFVESDEFHVRLLTGARLAEDYLHGLANLPADELAVKLQPRLVTGVEVLEVSPETPPGFYPLSFHLDSSGQRSLQWAGGQTIAIGERFRRYVLPDNRDGWIEVEITDVRALPAQSLQEALLIERKRFDRSTLGRLVDRATDWLEQTLLQVFLEPTLVATDPGAETYDVQANPLTLYARPEGKWPGIKFPYAHVQEVLWLAGHIGTHRVVDIPTSWLKLERQNGFTTLVPSGDPLLWTRLPFLSGILGGTNEIPGFWHFALRAGLRSPPEDLLDAIGKKAAMDALTRIGQAFKPGIGSESFSKEISVSTSYVRSAQANVLSATRAEYQAELAELLPRLRSRYLGLATTVII